MYTIHNIDTKISGSIDAVLPVPQSHRYKNHFEQRSSCNKNKTHIRTSSLWNKFWYFTWKIFYFVPVTQLAQCFRINSFTLFLFYAAYVCSWWTRFWIILLIIIIQSSFLCIIFLGPLYHKMIIMSNKIIIKYYTHLKTP